ncbi:hypothetical protein DASC09_049750 [Saccharomycopsis crataegensis]|uniref:YMC020W-like alpha/beta hydrolase domain-containing protein n=1 Tax=Saccharomycopsis crataegensis TaxID=43959 RepID=A0AAV5QSS9_9ASCO|nr:hypothetical protein DASC09_049750 [Saccharomycopsis crataegensis]
MTLLLQSPMAKGRTQLVATITKYLMTQSKDIKTNEWDINNWLRWKRKQGSGIGDAAATTSNKDIVDSFPEPDSEDNNNNNKLGDMISTETSEVSETIQGKSWYFWPNGSTSTVKESISIATQTTRSNTLYTEEISLNSDNIKPDILRSTTVTDSHNILVPSFEESLPKNTYYNQLSSLFITMSSKLGYEGGSQRKSQLTRNDCPNTSFSNVLIIGVHGFFPTKYLRPLIGEPTGTSIKFMSEAENAFKIWLKENKHYFGKKKKIRLSKIALEKEGKIFDRVKYFYDVLSKHDLNQYDFIYIAAHSQGTPVSIILMAQLLESGLISDMNGKLFGILGMAGISNGPFYGINQKIFVRAYSKIESDSMLELFEFQDFNSIQSVKYLQSLKILLSNNVRIAFVGSIDDQLVPLYSSVCSHIQHPNIFRSIYIDKDTETPNFLMKILNCALLLKNMGLNDHGIIKEISNALAGPLTGGGHSKIYNEFKVYESGIRFFLYSNPKRGVEDTPVVFKPFEVEKLGSNPYYLPFCLRGLMYESSANIENGERYVELMLKEFDDWNPNTKVLKDIKYRLSAMKAKL